MEVGDFKAKSFEKFDKEWALLTAGVPEDFNSMTISWGGLGTMWGMPVAFIVVKPSRYTFEFLQRREELTLSWYAPSYKKALSIFGSKSGRDTDKVFLTGFTPVGVGGSVTYKEAEETLICRRLFMQQLDKTKFPQEALRWYPEGTKDEKAHYLIIAEVKEYRGQE